MHDFEKLIHLLCDNKVDFVLIGGFAAVVHGVSTLTQDVDMAVSFDEKNAGRLLKALKGLHPIHRENKRPLTKDPAVLSKFRNLYLITDCGPVDLLSEVSGIGPFDRVRESAIEIELFGKRCRVLDIDALIQSKQEMKRPKDKEVILQLKAILERVGNGKTPHR